ncbi:SGNH/GDSL hydrolase family protein [Mycoplasmopsis columbina]|uniref:SGNH/GDSL hydrolase family protein n=1 Tax=Mycoplasmopsis columbina TaxID=114881 RepID=UPI0004A75161|nr:SGNH/GDSL hydrolase family protein [Mycoplasmopsis columbina]VEU77060.1 Predicted membrane protein [Mycoplasmopsis columbina]
MKIKLKQTLIVFAAALASTIGLGVGLSFIPTKEKTIQKGNDQPILENSKLDSLPGLPDNSNSSFNVGNNNSKKTLSFQPKTLVNNGISKNDKVNYLALGDSITAGWDGQLPQDYQGKLIDNQVTGLSYPAYLASFIQQSEEDKLNNFTNLAVSGSTFNDWNSILTQEYKTLNATKLVKLTKYFGSNLDDFYTKLVSQIKEANLLTVTLGANDALHLLTKELTKIPFAQLVDQIIKNKYNYAQIVQLINNTFQTVFDAIAQRQNLFVQKLKEINPNLNVNFISYPLPMSFIGKLLDKYIANNFGVSIQLSQILINLLNRKIAFGARVNNVNFINAYDAKYWINNVEKLAPLLFDIHPSAYGYKKMAMDIFTKLALKTDSLDKLQENHFDWSSNFYQSDKSSYGFQLEFKKNDLEIFNNLFTTDHTNFLYEVDKLREIHQNDFSLTNYYNRVISEERFSDLIINDLLISSLSSSTYGLIDPDRKLLKFLTRNNDENLNQIKNWALENNVFSSILRNTNDYFFTNDWDADGEPGAKEYKFEYLLESFRTQVLNETRIVKVITSFLQIPFLKNEDSKEELKQIIQDIISRLIELNISDATIEKIASGIYNSTFEKYISVDDFKTVIKKLIRNQNLKTSLGNIFVAVLDSSDDFINATTYQDLLNTFLSNQNIQNAISTGLNNLVTDLLSDNEFKQILARVVKNVTKEFNLNVEIDEQQIVKLIYELVTSLNDINNELHLLPLLIDGLVSEVTKNKFTNLNFANITATLVEKFKELFNQNNLENTVFVILKSLLKHNLGDFRDEFRQLILNAITNDKLPLNDLLTNKLIDILNDLTKQNLNKEELKPVLEDIYTSNEFSEFLKSIFNTLFDVNKEKLNETTNLVELSKLLTTDLTNSNLYESFNNLLQYILNKEEVKNVINTELTLNNETLAEFINADLIKNVFNVVLNNNSFKAIVDNFLNNAIFSENVDSFKYISNFETIIKNWLKDDENNQILVQHIKNFIGDIFQNDYLKGYLAKTLYDYLNENSNLVNQITKEDFNSLLNSLLINANDLISDNNIVDDTLNLLINQIKDHGFSNFSDSLRSKFNTILTNENLEQASLKLLKTFVKNQTITQNKNTIKQFLFNVLNETQLFNLKETLVNLINTNLNPTDDQEIKNKIEQSLTSLISSSQLSQLIDSTLTKLASISAENVEDKTNIFEVFKLILSDFVNSDIYRSLVNLVDFALSDENLKEFILSKLSNSSEKYKNLFNYDKLKTILISFLNNENFKNILTNFIDNAVLGARSFNDFSNLGTLLNTWFRNDEKITKLKENIVNFGKDILNNNDVKDLLKNLVYEILNTQTSLLTNIEEQNFKTLFDQSFDLLKNVIFDTDLLNRTVDILVKELQKGIENFDVKNLLTSFKNELFADNLEELVIHLVKKIVDNDLLSNNKETIKQLLINYLNSDLVASINNPFSDFLVNVTNGVFEKQQILKLLENIYKKDELKTLIDSLIDYIQEKKNELSNANTYSEVIKVLLNNIASSSLYKSLVDLLSTIVDKDQIILLLPENVKITLQPLLDNLENGQLANLAKTILKNQNLKDIINHFLGKVVLTDDFDLNNKTDLKSLFKNYLTNQEYRSFLTEKLTNLLNETLMNEDLKTVVSNLIKGLLDKYPSLKTNITNEEIETLVRDGMNSISLINQRLNIISNLIQVTFDELDQNFENPNFETIKNNFINKYISSETKDSALGSIFKVLIESNLLKNNKKVFVNLIKNLLSSNEVINVKSLIVNKINELINKDNDINLSTNIINAYENIIESTQFGTLLDSIFNQILNKDFNSFKDKTDILDILKTIVGNLSETEFFNSLVSLIDFILKNENVQSLLTEQLKKLPTTAQNFVTKELVTKTIIFAFNNSNLKTLLDKFVNEVVFATDKVDKLNNIKDELNKWLASESVQSAIKTNLSNFANDFIDNDEIKNIVKNNLKNYLGTYEGLLNNINDEEFNTLFNSLHSLIKPLNNEIDIVNKTLDSLVKELTKGIDNADFANVITSISSDFNEENLETTIVKLIKVIIKQNVLEPNKTLLAKLITNFLKSPISQTIKSKVANALNTLTNNKFNITTFENLLQNIYEKDEFTLLLTETFSHLDTLDNNVENVNTYFDLTKAITSTIINSNVFDKLIDLIAAISSKEQIKVFLPEELITTLNPILEQINDENLSSVIKLTFKNQNFKYLLNDFVNKGILEPANSFDSFKDLTTLTKNYLNNETNGQTFIDRSAKWLRDVIKSTEFSSFIGKLVFGFFDKYPQLKEDLTTQELEKLIQDMTLSFDSIDNELNLLTTFSTYVLEELRTNFDNFDFQNVIDKLVSRYFDDTNRESTIFEVIKVFIKNEKFAENINTLKILIKNIGKYFLTKEEDNLVTKLWTLLPEKIQNILNGFFDQNDLQGFLVDVLNSREADTLLSNLLTNLSQNINIFDNVNSLSDFIRVYLGDNERKNRFAQDVESVITFGLKHEKVKAIIKGTLGYNFAKYGINVNTVENQKLINDLHGELPIILRQLNLIRPAIDAILNNAENLFNGENIDDSILKTITGAINFTDFNIVKVILKSSTLNQNKETIKNDINTIIDGVTQDDTLIRKIIDDFSIDSVVQSALGLNKEETIETLVALFKSTYLRNSLKILVNEIITNNNTYANKNGWLDALSAFFNSGAANALKVEVKAWLKDLLINKPEIGNSIGTVAYNYLKSIEFKLTEAHLPNLKLFMQQILKGFANSNLLNDVVDALFESVKTLKDYNGTDYIGKIKSDAIKGATKFIRNGDKISISKIVDNAKVLEGIISYVDGQVFTNVVNALFNTTPLDKTKGIFSFLFGDGGSSGDSQVEFNFGTFWKLAVEGKLKDVLLSFFRPIVKNYFIELANLPKVNSYNAWKQASTSYRALWRIYTSLARIMYSQVSGFAFWNGTNTTAEGILYNHWTQMLDNVKNEYKTAISNKYGLNNIWFAGFDRNYNVDGNYWAGAQVLTSRSFWGTTSNYPSRSNSLSKTFYGRDHVLVYIYYPNDKDVKYNRNKTFTQVLMEDLIRGYMPVETK